MESPQASEQVFPYDLVIVGMGPAGLYATWRLISNTGAAHQAQPKQIALYDTMPESRVGGRLCTQPLPGYPFLAELGGMRFRSNQLLINALVDSLGLKKQVKEFKFDQKFYFLRERILTDEQFRAGREVPYGLSRNERGKRPHEIIQFAIHETLKNLTFGPEWFDSEEFNQWRINSSDLQKKLSTPSNIANLTMKEWAVIKAFGEYRNKDYLYNVGFWDLLQFQLSPGAWQLAHGGLGYESIMGNWNSAVALPWFITDFDDQTQVYTLQDGMSSITDQLYSHIKEAPNVHRFHKYDMSGVELCGSQGETLLRLTFKEDGVQEPRVVFTKSLILALPKGALVRLDYGDRLISKITDPGGVDQRSWFLDQLNSVDEKPLFKLFLGYPTSWWSKSKNWPAASVNDPTGKVNTDLPLRQVYYYGKEHWNESRRQKLGIQPSDQHSMIMASYSDSHYIEFWTEKKKRSGSHYSGLDVLEFSPEDQAAYKTFGAPAEMIVRAEHQLGVLHDEASFRASDGTPRAQTALYMEWSRPPYYAGWHSWKLGVEPWKICDLLMQPFNDVGLYICGEAYSDEQGWTEGALKSAERILTLRLNVPLDKDMSEYFDGETTPTLRDYIDASGRRQS